MPLIFGSTRIEKVIKDGTEIKDLYYGLTRVFKKRTLAININDMRIQWYSSLSSPSIPTIPVTINGNTYNITNSNFTRTRIQNPTSQRPYYIDKAVFSGTFDILEDSSISLSFRNYPIFYEGFDINSQSVSNRSPIITASPTTDITMNFSKFNVYYSSDPSDNDAEAVITTSPVISFTIT